MTDFETAAPKVKQREYREIDGVIYCDRSGCPGSTGLRCYRTGVPICKKCSVRTPVGYLSKDAARAQQDQFFNATMRDYVVAAMVAFFLSVLPGFFITQLGFGFFGWIIAFFLSTTLGGFISEVVFRVLDKRRGRHLARAVGMGIVLGALLLLPFAFFNFITWGIFAVVTTSTAVGRFQLGLRV